MNYIEFKDVLDSIKRERPILFQLEHDKSVPDEIVNQCEKYYGVRFPDSYRDFVKEIGGGYIGFLLIYSLDEYGRFYLLDHVSNDMVDKTGILSVIDLETGDYIGYMIEDDVCKEEMVIWLHEENEIKKLDKGFFEIILEKGLKL